MRETQIVFWLVVVEGVQQCRTGSDQRMSLAYKEDTCMYVNKNFGVTSNFKLQASSTGTRYPGNKKNHKSTGTGTLRYYSTRGVLVLPSVSSRY